MHRKMCKGCDTQFVALRADAVTCSPKCRKRYERECREITRRIQERERMQAARFEKLCDEATAKEG